MKTITKSYLKELTYEIIGAAIEVHKQLGPGLLEKVYEVCMVYELSLRGISVKSQQTIPVFYKGVILDAQLRYMICWRIVLCGGIEGCDGNDAII